MNTAPIMPATAPRIHLQWQKSFSMKIVAQCPAQASVTAGTILLIVLLVQPDVVRQPNIAVPERSVQAMLRQAEAQERLICEAETALARQSVRTYRQWYSHWRFRGVRVNDLLDMTWVWRQRTTAD